MLGKHKENRYFRKSTRKRKENIFMRNILFFLTAKRDYRRSNSTKFPASGVYNVSQPRVMSQVWRVREVVYAWIGVCMSAFGAVEVAVFVCLTLRRRIKSHLLFAGIIRSSPFSLR